MPELYQLLLYGFAIVALINIAYYLYFLPFCLSAKAKQPQSQPPPVTLVVCAKNEADNLRKHIPLWMAQDHPSFELILINDGSWDETLDVMEEFAARYPTIQITDVAPNEKFWGSKKYALTLGIKRARNEHLVFTDADCRPASQEWLRLIAQNFNQMHDIVLGYGAYEKVKNSFLNKIIRFETVFTALQYFSYATNKNPYMGTGRNLAYTAGLFYEKKGYVEHMQVRSGDDDLFVNAAATRSNTAICIAPEAFTISGPKRKFKAWYRQKRRHITTADRYKKRHQFALGLFYMSQFLFLLFSLFFLIYHPSAHIFIILVAVRYLVAALAFVGVSIKLEEKDLYPFFPLLEACLVCFQLFIFIHNLISKPKRWK
ncbi:MAG: glycosyl transferase family 2 [Cytophagaceae bacterium]|nr:glycosyl transferase family 2 [Cytophagaceae bacterium]